MDHCFQLAIAAIDCGDPGCPDRLGSDVVFDPVDHCHRDVPFEVPTRPSAGELLGGLLLQRLVQPWPPRRTLRVLL